MMTTSLTVLSIVTMFYPVTPTNESSPAPTQTLREIPGEGISWLLQREGGYLYADKSIYLERLLDNRRGNIFFYMTRPRRFGKTSFLEMSQHFFHGNKTLFDGLRIGKRGNADFFNKPKYGGVPEELKDKIWIQCPVIYLDFSEIVKLNNMTDFEALHNKTLRNIARSYGLEYTWDRVPFISVPDLIVELQFKFQIKVVVLIDEYDSPYDIALKKKNRVLAEEISNFLDDLFRGIKSKIGILRLVLILGVSRLALTSLQSGGNNYVDLTYKEEFAGAFGFTSEEIQDFQPEIEDQFNVTSKKEIDGIFSNMRKQYDGYNFTFQYKDGKKESVLNPVSTMKCLDHKEFGCYWSETSNINEVIRRLHFSKEPLKAFEHIKLLRKNIEKRRNPAREIIPLEILMFVYGYLTIESYDEINNQSVVLNFPNNEIRTALQQNIDSYELNLDKFLSEEHGWLFELRWHMETGRLEGTMNTLTKMFADTSFSKTLQQGMNEFSNTVRLTEKLRMASISCRESVTFTKKDSNDGGDVDLQTVRLKKNFIMSIKQGRSATEAMNQLIGYLKEHRTTFLEAIGEPVQAWFVGINFDSRTGGSIHEWIGVPFENGILSFDECKASLPNLCGKFEHDTS